MSNQPFKNKRIFRTGKLKIHPNDFVWMVNQLGTDKITAVLDKSVDVIIIGSEPSSVAMERYQRMSREDFQPVVYQENEFMEFVKAELNTDFKLYEDFANNPLWYRRVCLTGKFLTHSTIFYKQMLQKNGALLYPKKISKNTNYILMGENPDMADVGKAALV